MNKEPFQSRHRIGPFTFSAGSTQGQTAEEIIENDAKHEAAVAYTNYEVWEFKAKQLALSAEILREREKHEIGQIPEMLYGLAIEVSLKGRIIKNWEGPKLENKQNQERWPAGHVPDFDKKFKKHIQRFSHDLERMFGLAGIELSDDERRIAYKLTNMIENFGKYPIGKPVANHKENNVKNFSMLHMLGEEEYKLVIELGIKAGLDIPTTG